MYVTPFIGVIIAAGPSRIDVTEQYKVHSASTVVFKAAPAPQVRRATSARPRVQFLDVHTWSGAQHGTRLSGVDSGHWQTPSDPHPVSRSASLDPQSLRVRRQLTSDDLEIDDGRNPQQDQILIDPAPPYPSQAGQHSSLGGDFHSSIAGRSPSVASSSRITGPQSKCFISRSYQDECRPCTLGSPVLSRSTLTPDIPYGSPASSDFALSRTSSIEEVPADENEGIDTCLHPNNVAYYGLSRVATSSSGRSSEQDHRGRSHSRFSLGRIVHVLDTVKDRVRSRSPRDGSRSQSNEQEERGRSLAKGKGKARVGTHGMVRVLPQIGVAEPSVADGVNDQSGDGWVVFPEGALLTYHLS